MSTKLVPVTSKAHFTELVNTDTLTCFMFTATWCRPCQQVYPEIRRMATMFGGEVLFATVDGDDLREVVTMCKVRAFPTFMLIRNGKQLDYVVGGDHQAVEEKVKAQLKKIRDEDNATRS
jgi:thioredoxin 1